MNCASCGTANEAGRKFCKQAAETEAREILGRLGARAYLDRLDAFMSGREGSSGWTSAGVPSATPKAGRTDAGRTGAGEATTA